MLGLGIAQQCISIWELLSNVIRYAIPQQRVRIGYSSVCIEIGNCSAIFQDKLYLKDVLGLGIAQQCISIWELLSNVIRYAIPQQRVRIEYSSAMY